MICKMCRTAADIQTRAREARFTIEGEISACLNESSQILHNECKGCDCQHQIHDDLAYTIAM